MMNRIISVLLFTMLTISSALAHAIWIETAAEGSIGKSQEIRIYYGEYPAQQFEETTAWYSDVNTFTLWLVAPDGKKTQLKYTAGDKHFVAEFTPDKSGNYVITTGHSAKDIDGTMVYQFNASAVVAVGKGGDNVSAIANNELFLQPLKVAGGKKGAVKAFFKGKPASKISITVSGPTGWSKSFETDENGYLEFDLLWKGWFALEGFYTTTEHGTIADKSYEKIWRCATARAKFD